MELLPSSCYLGRNQPQCTCCDRCIDEHLFNGQSVDVEQHPQKYANFKERFLCPREFGYSEFYHRRIPVVPYYFDSEIDYSEETSNGSAELENMNGSLSSIKRSSKIEDLLQKQMHKSDSVERINAPCERQTSSASPAVNGSLRGSRTGSYDRLGRQSSPYTACAASYKSPDKFGGSIDRLAISGSRNKDVKHSSPKMSPRTHSSSHGDIPNNSSYHSERFPKRDIDSKKYVSEQVLNSPLNSDAPFHRVGSSQSNPTPTPPHKYNAFDDRSMTPDTYYRTVGGYPGIKTPLITSRASLASHQSSTHTLTPTVLNGDGHRNPSPNEAAGYDIRVTDLENRLFNANQGLEDQAIEITRLRHQIQDMESENNVMMREVDRERRKHAPSVHQDDNSKLIAEKEALATEVMKLTSEIELLQSEQRHSDSGDSHHSIDKYSPDNPNALKRQIEELKSQVQDLQEANESAALELNTMEQRLNENESLKAANDSFLEDLEKENESLRDQIRDLKKKSTQYLNSSSDRTREEMKCLRLDMRKLRERNSEVNEENLKLRDQLTELRLRAERKSKKPETPLITNGYSHNTHNHEFTSPKIERTVSGTVEGIVDSTDRLRKVEKYLEDNRFYAAEDILYDGKKSEYVDTSEIEPMYAKHNSYLVHSNRFEPKARRTLALDGIENIEPKGDPLLTDRSDSTAFLTSNQFTRMFEPIDINENDLVEYPKRYPYPSSARSATSVGSNKMPPIKQKGTTQQINYLGDDLRSPRSNFNDSFDTPRNLPRQNLTESFNLKTINGEDDDEDSTSSILSEVERELGIPTKHLRTNSSKTKRRSKSPDATPQELSAVGFRSISPRPIATQHNKGSLASPRDAKLITSGMHPYVPRSPADVKIGSVVKFSRQTGQISRGLVRFIGHLPGRDDTYLGLELENEDGKHDGTYNNVRYFACKPNKGVFVTFNKVVMAWVSY